MDNAARDQLIRNHLPLVRRVSEHLRASWRESGLEIDDLVAWGTVGLTQAADRFDPTRGVSFKTYAELVIKGAIRDGVGRGTNWFGRRAAGSVSVVHLNDMVPDGWEDWLGQPTENGLLLQALWNGQPLFQPPSDGDRDLRSLLADEIRRLPERERRVILLCFYEGKKLTQAANEMRIRLPLASRLRKKALRRLHQTIGKSRNRRPPEPVDRKEPTDNQEPVRVVGPTGSPQTAAATLPVEADLPVAA